MSTFYLFILFLFYIFAKTKLYEKNRNYNTRGIYTRTQVIS